MYDRASVSRIRGVSGCLCSTASRSMGATASISPVRTRSNRNSSWISSVAPFWSFEDRFRCDSQSS